MEITREDKDTLNTVITINIAPEDYTERVSVLLKDYRRKATMPGFRQGKVPMGMIKKMYELPVMADEINKIVNENLFKYIEDNKLRILGNPLPNPEKQSELIPEQPVELAYDLGLAPDFEVKLSDKDKFPMYQIEASDDMIDKELDNLARRFGSMTEMVESTPNSMLMGDFNELDENGEIKEGGIYHTSSIVVEYLENEAAKTNLTGLKIGDTVEVNPRDISKGDVDMTAMLGLAKEQADQVGDRFRYTVTKISEMSKAELDQSLFDQVFGPGNVNSLEEFRQKIKEDLESMLARESERKLENDIIEKLIDKLKLELPDDFLKRFILSTSEDEDMSEEKLEEDYDNYAKALRWELIENKIIEENELRASQEEFLDYTVNLLKQQMLRYGQTEFDDEGLKQSAYQVLANQEQANQIGRQLHGQKVFQYLKDTVSLKDKSVSYDDFVKLATEKPEKSNFLSKLIGT